MVNPEDVSSIHSGVSEGEKSYDENGSVSMRDGSFISRRRSRSRDRHYFDPNLDYDNYTDFEEEDDSPYPEVRSAVANFDDTEMPVSTIRSWVLGLMLAVLLPACNQLFYFRYPSVKVGGLVAQLVVFPVGRLWARYCPNIRIRGIPLNPGPFTIKEHVLVTIMASVGAENAYATDLIAVQRVFYKQRWNFGYEWMLVASTQLIGFSIGGIAKRFLVTPASMIWPNTLVSCALFNTLHSQSYVGIGNHEGMSRENYFFVAFAAAFIWYFIPGYLFQALSVFTWVCWIAPQNTKINQLFGYRSGLGFSILTFDWSMIAYLGSPLATPWWAEANVIIGFLFFFWFLSPLLHHFDVWRTQFMPIIALNAYDNAGKIYDVNRIINESNKSLDVQRYEEYSKLYLPLTYIMGYGLEFLSISATITHSIIHFYKPIKDRMKKSLRETPDIHARLMTSYLEVPEWQYGCIFVVTFILACVTIKVWPTGLEIWALIVALLLSFTFVIPLGMIQAVTNRSIGLNVFAELIIGYMLPGRPIALMIFKTYGYIALAQALKFTQDFKLGHYMKIPPRQMFWCQIVATLVAGTSQLGVQSWMFANIPDFCTDQQKNYFICAGTQVFGTASVIWGVIGPSRFFTKEQTYYFPLLFGGLADIPPATAVNYVPWAIVGFIFQYIIRRRHFSYWAKYNYVLSAALDGGTAVGIVLVYFALQFPMNGQIGANSIQKWWGNTVFMNTMDWQRTAYRHPPDIVGKFDLNGS